MAGLAAGLAAWHTRRMTGAHPDPDMPPAMLALPARDAVPVANEAELRACQPPRAHWTKPHNYDGLMPELNHVSLTHDGALYWNGQPISTAKLGEYLRRTHRMEPAPEIFLGAEMGVACRDLEAVRNLMEKTLDCRQPYSQCAEGLMPVWREIENPPGTPPS